MKENLLKKISTKDLIEELCQRTDISESAFIEIIGRAKTKNILENLYLRNLTERQIKDIIYNCGSSDLELISDVSDAIDYINEKHLTKGNVDDLCEIIGVNYETSFTDLPSKMAFNVFIEHLKNKNPFEIIKKLEQ